MLKEEKFENGVRTDFTAMSRPIAWKI